VKDVLVTGGNGFIGRYVVEELQKRGKAVSVLDRHMHRSDGGPSGRKGDVDLFFGDVKDAGLVSEAVAHVDGVIHLAGVLGTQETVAHPRAAAETNILGGLNVIEACAQYDVPLINIAVGNYWMNNTYSITKNSIERFVEMTRKYRGKAMGSVRALNAYGPRQVPVPPYGPSRVRKILPSFICRALSDEPIEIYGDGQQVMDMIWVADVAFILVSALEHLDMHGNIETIEAGTGRATTVNDIADAVHVEVLTQADIDADIKHLPMRPGEDERAIVKADTSTLEVLGIKPDKLMPLEQGVAETVTYFMEYLSDR
jgi:UDP-glucose 4-epimerase